MLRESYNLICGMPIFHLKYFHLKLEIALAIPSSNEWNIAADITFSRKSVKPKSDKSDVCGVHSRQIPDWFVFFPFGPPDIYSPVNMTIVQ